MMHILMAGGAVRSSKWNGRNLVLSAGGPHLMAIEQGNGACAPASAKRALRCLAIVMWSGANPERYDNPRICSNTGSCKLSVMASLWAVGAGSNFTFIDGVLPRVDGTGRIQR